MASEVDISNFALNKVGANRISSLSESNKRAVACNDAYYIARDALLSEHPWNFATRRIELPKISSDPLYGFSAQFQLPNDCVFLVSTENDDIHDYEYKIEENKYFLSNDEAVKVEYISNDVPTGEYHPKFVEALGYKLASELAYSLVQSNELADRLEGKYQRYLADARLADARNGSPRQLQKSEWTDERL